MAAVMPRGAAYRFAANTDSFAARTENDFHRAGDTARELAASGVGRDERGYRREFAALVDRARDGAAASDPVYDGVP